MTLSKAKKLRMAMTDAERRLWYRLRAHRFCGIKFKRQVPIGKYIVDFACLERKLIIEVDGGQHNEARDGVRSASLEQQGFRLVRFWNNDVLRNTTAVLETIAAAIGPVSPSPGTSLRDVPPSPKAGEGETSIET